VAKQHCLSFSFFFSTAGVDWDEILDRSYQPTHCESGACDSEIYMVDYNESAAICLQWKAYLVEEYRDKLLSCLDLSFEYSDTVYPFKCPERVMVFTRLSGLSQHAYSKACNQNLTKGRIGKLVRWLEVQHSGSGSE
jgi:hypothetical protein